MRSKNHVHRGTPLFLFPKKDGTFRPIIDFRLVSAVTLYEQYSLPVLSEHLISLGRGNSIFWSLDLLSSYWQVELEPASGKITAFCMPSGYYEWLRMHFGLKSATLTFQRMINNLFAGMLWNCVCISWPHYCQQGSGNTLKNLTSGSSEVTRGCPQSKTIQVRIFLKQKSNILAIGEAVAEWFGAPGCSVESISSWFRIPTKSLNSFGQMTSS